ncbi:MAG: hypothetical protein ACOYMA_10490 [Bacteroidia bacterium]
MKLLPLIINLIDIEGFLYVNFIPLLLLFSLIVFVIYNYRIYFNYKQACPKCGAVQDISRIKKNKIFKMVGFTDAYRKYSCGKCRYKFYIFNKNIDKTKTT